MSEPNARTELRDSFVEYLRQQYLGPVGGPQECLKNRPDRVYLVGTLYPRGRAAERADGSVLGDESTDEALDEPVELANAWHPASTAISFLHDGDALVCTIRAGHYVHDSAAGSWNRSELLEEDLPLVNSDARTEVVEVLDGRARLVAVWRRLGAKWLVTVALENAALHDDAESPPPTEECLFQVHFRCAVIGGAVLPYPSSDFLSEDPEEQELRLMYRERRVYGVGHGCSVNWQSDQERVGWVETEMMPTSRVPGVMATGDDSLALELRHLADEGLARVELCVELDAFVAAYAAWVEGEKAHATLLPSQYQGAAIRLLGRMDRALARMREGVDLLRSGSDEILASFRLANRVMREQILQSSFVRSNPGRRGRELDQRSPESSEPKWRPFQLAFLLLSLPSTVVQEHPDRDVVDLIWFPTGGGKTEAYLGLAAIEMIHRRLTRGIRGGGTAVLTRYTLRLLTAQQFQRAASLICALELLRQSDDRLRPFPAFTIGLWVGGETTPNNFKDAHEQADALKRAQAPESPFQIQQCPWCGTDLFPQRRTTDGSAYGVRATDYSFELYCPHDGCPFHENLPVMVVDEQIFQDPPTLVVATVDKFARMPRVARAGAILGMDNSPFDPPGLIIQDELHLLSGPLGTTVALYEAAIQSLIAWGGAPPKIVASTATIRSAGDQVRSLFAADVALFPPSGLSVDDSYFARTDHESPGRMYVGLMPQAHTQSFSTVLACVALLQASCALEPGPDLLDSYWTVVAYHNSLRELGRTVTIVRDDVVNMLRARDDGQGAVRKLQRDGVIELTSNVSSSQLGQFLRRLEKGVGTADTVDLVATTNMLSVGIDISRLGLMLMNGQPKTTAEYIQATSRVGRASVPGLVVTLLRASKPRDRSHYEGFRAYHESLYRHVEPTSITPWSIASRDRSLRAALVLLVRHGCGLRENDSAGDFRSTDPLVRRAADTLLSIVQRADPDEAASTADEVQGLVLEWDRRARRAQDEGGTLRYESNDDEHPALLRDFGEARDGWSAMHSMRSVDRQVRVIARGEQG